MKIRSLIKPFIINSSFFAIILIIGELFFRAFYPEFKGDYFSENITRSINYRKGNFKGIELARTPRNGFLIDTDSDMFLIIGGSITQGFGLPYEDIYWVKIKRLHNLIKESKLEVIAINDSSIYRSNIMDQVRIASNEFSQKNKYIIYQFNFNDVVTNRSQKNKNMDKQENNILASFDQYLRILAIQHLHKSVMVRVSRYYIGLIKRNSIISKSCKEKGILSLQGYTYAFGSKGFEKEAQLSWQMFEGNLSKLKDLASELEAKLIVFISPTVFDIDINSIHPYINPYGLDFSCSTIEPREKLRRISKQYNIRLIDPTSYLKKRFESNLKDGNFIRFYMAGDVNHITPTASSHLSNYLFSKIFFD